MIKYDDFSKLELKIATITAAERVEGSEKLIKLQLELGTPDLPAGRQVVAGIGKSYEPETLIGKQIVIIANLEPRSLMGVESNGMLLAASDESGPILLIPEKAVPLGTGIK